MPSEIRTAKAIEPVLRIVTLNVNGIRSAASKGLFRWLRRAEPDVVCLQEVKADEVDIPEAFRFPDGLHGLFHCAQRRGYSGAALYAAKEPRSVRLGFGSAEFDAEGRYVEAEFRDLTVISVYFPSGSSGPGATGREVPLPRGVRAAPRTAAASGREVVFCGDINIAHKEIDLKNWRSNRKNSGFLPEERAWLSDVFDATAGSTCSGDWTTARSSTPGGAIAARPGRRTSAGASTTRSPPRAWRPGRAAPRSTPPGASPITRRSRSTTPDDF